MMVINAAAIALSIVFYGVRKIILKNGSLNSEGKSSEISQTKELFYKNLFFVLYVTYLSTCFKTATVLPLSCREICRDTGESFCSVYLKADYNIQCTGPKYKRMAIAAYISTAYLFALPTASFIALWKQRGIVPAERIFVRIIPPLLPFE